MQRLRFTIILIMASFCLQGCALGILAAGVGYAVNQGRKGTAAQMEAKGKFLDRYNTYKIEMEKINIEREKASLAARPIDEFEVWLDKQPLTPEEQKLYWKYKQQTPTEVKQAKLDKEEPQNVVEVTSKQTQNEEAPK